MKVVSPLGQILGPKGLMPNPKSETVTKDVKTAVKNAKSGQIRYKSDKQGIIHTRIGQVGYSEEQVRDNLEAFLTDLKKVKPPSSKGVFISKVSISSTMGKGFDIDLTTLNF
jgi:large subunit ribosomal protein L1